MFRVRRAYSSSKQCRLHVEWLEGRQVLSSLASLHRAAAPIAISELVHETKAPAAIVHQVKDALSKHALKGHETLDALANTPATVLVETADKELKHVDSLARKELAKADDLLPTAANVSHLLDKAEKLANDSAKETTKLADSVLRSESLTAVRNVVHSQKELVADLEQTPSQLPDAGGDQAQLDVKPKPVLGGAVLDFAFATSRSALTAGENDGELYGRHPIDAGRLGHEIDADQEHADASSRLFAQDDPEGLDLFSTRKETTSASALAFLAKLDGTVGDGAEGMGGNVLDSSLSGGPAIDGTALDSAITRFFAQLDALGRDLVNSLTAHGLTPWIVGIGLGMMSMELARRRVNLRRAALAAANSGWAPGLPLPGAYL